MAEKLCTTSGGYNQANKKKEMRKAKNIAKELNEFLRENDDNREAITRKAGEIFQELLDDSVELVKSRNSDSNSVLLGVLRESNQRWNAVVGRCNMLKKDGFKAGVLKTMPHMKLLWK